MGKRGNCFKCGSKEKYKKSEALICSFFSSEEKDAWYSDSAATEHMSGRREWFRNFIEFYVPYPVRIGNGDAIYAIGQANIDVLVFDGIKWLDKHLADVWYVRKLFVNLFSQGRCLDKGCIMHATEEMCVFKRDGRIIAMGLRQTTLYRMMIRTNITEQYANVAVKQNIRLWHERLVHQNIAQVKSFLNKNCIEFIDEKNFQCQACIMGKHHRLPFTRRNSVSFSCGEILHTDVCEKMLHLVERDIFF